MSKAPPRGIRTLRDVACFLEVIYHYRVEFRKLFQQLIKLQFPLSPQKLLDNQIAGGKVDPADLNILYEWSAALSKDRHGRTLKQRNNNGIYVKGLDSTYSYEQVVGRCVQA